MVNVKVPTQFFLSSAAALACVIVTLAGLATLFYPVGAAVGDSAALPPPILLTGMCLVLLLLPFSRSENPVGPQAPIVPLGPFRAAFSLFLGNTMFFAALRFPLSFAPSLECAGRHVLSDCITHTCLRECATRYAVVIHPSLNTGRVDPKHVTDGPERQPFIMVEPSQIFLGNGRRFGTAPLERSTAVNQHGLCTTGNRKLPFADCNVNSIRAFTRQLYNLFNAQKCLFHSVIISQITKNATLLVMGFTGVNPHGNNQS